MSQFQIAENKVFNVEGRDFLFLVKENAIFELDSRTKRLLEECPRSEDFAKNGFLNFLDGSCDEKTELFEGLIDRRIIVSKAEGKRYAASSMSQTSIPLGTLILTVTDDCNLGCLYCYHNDGKGADTRSETMTSETARRSIDFLFENSGDLPKVVIVFFGGEPFLNFDLIASSVEYAREKADGREIDFAVTTNGTLLTDEVARFVEENKIGVTISIDGAGDVHDRYRCFPDGSPSFGAIEKKLADFLQIAQSRPVVARATVVRDYEDLLRTADQLLDLGFAEVGFAPVTTSDATYQLGRDEMNRLLAEFEALSGRFLDVAARGDLFGFSNLIDLLVVLHEGEVKSHPCGAGIGLLAVDPAGRLCLCQRLTGSGRPCLGDVFEGLDRAEVDEFRKKAEEERQKFCGGCWVKAVCAGGCYHEALVREGSPTRPNRHYCEWIKGWIEIGMGVYGKLVIDSPDYVDKLSAFRGHAPLFSQYN
jgi:uncharacterized protein